MSIPETSAEIISQVHINQLDPDTGRVVPGWEISVRDLQSRVIVPIFVPDAVYGSDQAKTLIQHALDKVRAVHNLTF